MTPERYRELSWEAFIGLTPEELSRGWHFCPDWDYMLIGPNMKECESCTCTSPKCANCED